MALLAAFCRENLATLAIFVCVLVLACLQLFPRRRRRAQLPPGPTSLPVIGSLLSLGRGDPREIFRQLQKKYGDVFTVGLGSEATVVLNSLEAMQKYLVRNGKAFSGRPQESIINKYVVRNMGVIMMEGDFWRTQRKFTHQVFRTLIPNHRLEELISTETIHLTDHIRSFGGKPVNTQHLFNPAVSNIISQAVFGRRYDYHDPKMVLFHDTLNRNCQLTGSSGVLTLFPWTRYLPGDPFRFKEFLSSMSLGQTLISDLIQDTERVKGRRTVGQPSSLIEAFRDELEREEVDESFTEPQLRALVGDLFGAGTETTATALRWSMLYFIHYPEVMRKAQLELDCVVGREQCVRLSDRSRLPYFDATILEILRLGDIAPFAVPHSTTEDTNIDGYLIPSNTQVFANLNAVHFNEEIFPEPQKMKPERFLNGDETKVVDADKISPFGLGKRHCLGESLARAEIFLLLSSLVKNFSVKFVGSDLPSTKGILGVTSSPTHFEAIFNPRE